MIIPQYANLKLWMPMKLESGNLYDLSGTTPSSSITEGSIQSTPGILGSGIEMLATNVNQILVANSIYDIAPNTADWTFAFWAKPGSTDVNNSYNGVFSNLLTGYDTGYYALYFRNNSLSFTTSGNVYSIHDLPVTIGQWQFNVWTRTSGGISKVYANGKYVSSLTQSVTYGSQSRYQGIHFGQYRKDDNSYKSKTSLNHFMMWNKVLTDKEISVLYNSTKGAYLL